MRLRTGCGEEKPPYRTSRIPLTQSPPSHPDSRWSSRLPRRRKPSRPKTDPDRNPGRGIQQPPFPTREMQLDGDHSGISGWTGIRSRGSRPPLHAPIGAASVQYLLLSRTDPHKGPEVCCARVKVQSQKFGITCPSVDRALLGSRFNVLRFKKREWSGGDEVQAAVSLSISPRKSPGPGGMPGC